MKRDWKGITNEELIKMLPKLNCIDAPNAICELKHRNAKTEDVKKALVAQTKNNVSFWNDYLFSDFAYAALDLLGFQKYNGNKEEILNLISVQLIFK